MGTLLSKDGRTIRPAWFFLCAASFPLMGVAHAETMSGALSQAYNSNPNLGQSRANVRALDENISKSSAGYRPKINAQYSVTGQYFDVSLLGNRVANQVNGTGVNGSNRLQFFSFTHGPTLTVQQTLFDGAKTFNTVRQAESQVMSGRETLRGTEQDTLLAAATSYMNVLRDTAILGLLYNNVLVLQEQLRQVKARYNSGDLTQTDVAQTDSNLSTARANHAIGTSNLQNSMAAYRQVIGREPRRLDPAKSLEYLLPKRLQDAIEMSQVDHPAIAAALHDRDAAELAVKMAESALYPNVTVNAALQHIENRSITPARSLAAAISGTLNVPIYQGGNEYSEIRQSKERVSQARLIADVQRDQVRAALVGAWGQLEATKVTIASGEGAVASAALALAGIREEAKIGQRTTYDILTAQQTLLNARINLVASQRDRIVNSYGVLASMGRLRADVLGLKVNVYEPTVHFDQVKDKLFGVRTPDGR